MACALFGGFESKAKRMKDTIADLEAAIEGKKIEEADAAGRLRDTLTAAIKEIERLPLAGALSWKRRGND